MALPAIDTASSTPSTSTPATSNSFWRAQWRPVSVSQAMLSALCTAPNTPVAVQISPASPSSVSVLLAPATPRMASITMFWPRSACSGTARRISSTTRRCSSGSRSTMPNIATREVTRGTIENSTK